MFPNFTSKQCVIFSCRVMVLRNIGGIHVVAIDFDYYVGGAQCGLFVGTGSGLLANGR